MAVDRRSATDAVAEQDRWRVRVRDAAAPAPSTAPKTTTRKALWILCVLLLIATVVVAGTSWWVSQNVYNAVATVRDTTAPSILHVFAARDSLVTADSAAVDSFRSGEVKLIGPGLRYQNQLTSASQHLVQVAESNTAGKGSLRIQLIEALLESYSSLIEQADAHAGTPLGTADLWAASHLLHAGDSPILVELNNLVDDQTGVLRDQISASAMTPENLLTLVVPIVLLFILLFVTQIFLSRRFRRTVNLPLLAATFVLVGLSIVAYLAVASQHRLENSQNTLNEVVRLWRDQPAAADVRGQQELGELMAQECGGANGGCGFTINQFVANRKSADNTAAGVSDERLNKRIRDFNDRIDSAGKNAGRKPFIPILAGLIFALIPFGLWPRIKEYRYRTR